MNQTNSKLIRQIHSQNQSHLKSNLKEESQSKVLRQTSSLPMIYGHRKTKSLKIDLDQIVQRPTFGYIAPSINRTNNNQNNFCFEIDQLSKHQSLQMDPRDIDAISSIYNKRKCRQTELKLLKNSLQEIILKNNELGVRYKFLQSENILERQKHQKLNKKNLKQQNLRLKQQLNKYLRSNPLKLLRQVQKFKKEYRQLRLKLNTIQTKQQDQYSNNNYYNKKFFKA